MGPLLINLFTFFCLFQPAVDTVIDEKKDFTVIKKGSGMELAERWIKMDDGTDSREVRFTMNVNATIMEIIETLKSESAGIAWNANASVFKIKELEKDRWVSYILYKLPFPLSDREYCMINDFTMDGDKGIIHYSSYDLEIFKEVTSNGQTEAMEGKWVISPKGAYSQVSYHIVSVPDRSLPKWIVDPIIRKNIWTSMEKLRSIIEQQKL